MHAKLKRVSADDVDIESYVPEDPDCFFVTMRLCIGAHDSNGGDDFEVFVCSPVWLERNVWEPTWGRHFLITKCFNYEAIVNSVVTRIEMCEGESWLDVASKLARFFAWEFEDYQP